MLKDEMRKRLRELQVKNERIIAQMNKGRLRQGGKIYAGLPLEPELERIIRPRCSDLLSSQLDNRIEGSGLLFLVYDDAETIAGITEYVAQYSYNNEDGTFVTRVYRAIELPL